MSKQLVHELHCRDCNKDFVTDDKEFVCPECGEDNTFSSDYIVCDCGEKVYLTRFTNICYGCEKIYNRFGEELAPIEDWDDDDRYASFGPQNGFDDYY